MNIIVKKFLIKNINSLILLFLIQCISMIITTLLTYYTGRYIDGIVVNLSHKYIYEFLRIFIIIFIVSNTLNYFNSILLTRYKNHMFYYITSSIMNHVNYCKYNIIRNKNSAYLTEEITNDSNIIVEFIFTVVINSIINIAQFIVILIILYKINHKITFVLLASIPIYILIYMLSKYKIYEKSLIFRNTSSKLHATNQEIISKVWFTKVNSLYNEMLNKQEQAYKNYFKSALNYSKFSSILSILQNLIINSTQLIMFIMCGLSIINKTLTVGQFTILNNYYNIIMQQLRYFLNLGTNFQKFRVSMNRLQEILSIKTDKDGNILLNEIHSIKIKGLRNSFEKNELKSFTYEFYSGKIYCLNGANGTGKSSLINSLLNIDQDYEGKVYINDIDISDLNMAFIRKHLISLSEQTPIIFDKDIDYNLNLFNNTSLNDIFTNSEFIKKNISANTLSGGEKKK